MNKLAVAFLALPVALFVACDEGGTPPTDYSSVLRSVSELGEADTKAFSARADELVAALRALESAPDATSLAKAQGAWRASRAAFRKLDALHVGPVADLQIGERIDVSASPSDIDAIVGGGGAIDLALVAAAPGSQKGFLGAEHLLFSTSGADAALAALTGDGEAARRRTLARAIGEEIAQSAHQLQDAWTAGDRPIGAEIAGAGRASERYPTQRAAMDDVVVGVGYGIELVAGIRLGRTLGKNAGGTPNPAMEPAATSDSAVADMTATMAGVAAVYDDTGFGRHVKDKSTPLDARVTSQIADCTAKAKAIPSPYVASLTSNTATVEAAYDSCKALRTLWNTDLASAMGATLKPSDNDGD